MTYLFLWEKKQTNVQETKLHSFPILWEILTTEMNSIWTSRGELFFSISFNSIPFLLLHTEKKRFFEAVGFCLDKQQKGKYIA